MSIPADVIRAWDFGDPHELVPEPSGLINTTFFLQVRGEPRAVIQRLNTSIFDPVVHEDIEAVTAHLEARGLCTPRLIRTRAGELWHRAANGEIWRALSFVGDRTVHKLSDPADARSAGRLVAAFHRAARDLSWRFRAVRGGFHDTALRMRGLEGALAAERGHRLYSAVAPLAEELLSAWRDWPPVPALPRRIVHGDLKLSNVRFSGPRACALIDLDTMGWGTLDAELGDALRSWCNPAREDEPEARFDLEIFSEAVRGYAEGGGAQLLEPAERRAIVGGVERIALELAARFATDALEERYFGWDARYGTRGDHNLLRARGQLSLFRAVVAARQRAALAVERAFAP